MTKGLRDQGTKGRELVRARRPLIAMRGYHGGVILQGPWKRVRAPRIDWGVVGAIAIGAVFGYAAGVLSALNF